jgi:hypothetical protein
MLRQALSLALLLKKVQLVSLFLLVLVLLSFPVVRCGDSQTVKPCGWFHFEWNRVSPLLGPY